MTEPKTVTPVAVVTGGRRGIGRGCCTALADAGFDIVIVDLLNDDDTLETAAEIKKRGRKSAAVNGDISDVSLSSTIAEQAYAAFGAIDCLVNNAGVLPKTRGRDLLEVTPDTFDQVMNINLRGTFFLTQEIARRMIMTREAGERPVIGSIVTVSSGVVGKPRQDSPEYAFSKSSLALMSQMFALRLGPWGIHTYELRPGMTKTEMSRDAWDMYDNMIQQGRFPIPRVGLPEDVGHAAAVLAKGLLPYSTGEYFNLDGGFHLPFSGPASRKVPPARK
jgi:NAD(P)-dependent dehydrogenase (short-subunit alcohol dehydrogenase family)